MPFDIGHIQLPEVKVTPLDIPGSLREGAAFRADLKGKNLANQKTEIALQSLAEINKARMAHLNAQAHQLDAEAAQIQAGLPFIPGQKTQENYSAYIKNRLARDTEPADMVKAQADAEKAYNTSNLFGNGEPLFRDGKIVGNTMTGERGSNHLKFGSPDIEDVPPPTGAQQNSLIPSRSMSGILPIAHQQQLANDGVQMGRLNELPQSYLKGVMNDFMQKGQKPLYIDTVDKKEEKPAVQNPGLRIAPSKDLIKENEKIQSLVASMDPQFSKLKEAYVGEKQAPTWASTKLQQAAGVVGFPTTKTIQQINKNQEVLPALADTIRNIFKGPRSQHQIEHIIASLAPKIGEDKESYRDRVDDLKDLLKGFAATQATIIANKVPLDEEARQDIANKGFDAKSFYRIIVSDPKLALDLKKELSPVQLKKLKDYDTELRKKAKKHG